MKKTTFVFLILMSVSALAHNDSLVEKFPEFGVYHGVDAMGKECRVKIETFHMQTFSEEDTYRDITLETAEMKFEYLFFKRLTNGKGNMELNSFYKSRDAGNTYRYSHIAPDVSFRWSGHFLDFDRVLRTTAEIDLNEKRILKIKYYKTFSSESEKEVTCSNLKRLPKLTHLKETLDIMNQSLSIAYSNLDKHYGEGSFSGQRMRPSLLGMQKDLESYLNKLNNGSDPDTIINELPEAYRRIHNLTVVFQQTPYITAYIENAFFKLQDFVEYSH
jgi:hypothetical protein